MFLSLGEALIDLIPSHAADIRQTTELSIQPGGAPLNVAVALKRLGIPVAFVGTCSIDAFGGRLADLLAREGIPRVPIQQVDGPTRLAVVDHASLAGASFRFYGDDTADTLLAIEDVDAAFASEPSGLYVTSLLLANARSAAVQRYAVELAIASGVPVFTDPNPRLPAWPDHSSMESAVRWLLATSQYAKLSLDDARALGWVDQPQRLITRLKSETPADVVVTDGERGCWALIDDQVVHIPAPRVVPADPTGAGDAFCGAIIASVVTEGRLTVEGLHQASVAGALATTAEGAASGLPTDQEIERFLASDGPNGDL